MIGKYVSETTRASTSSLRPGPDERQNYSADQALINMICAHQRRTGSRLLKTKATDIDRGILGNIFRFAMD